MPNQLQVDPTRTITLRKQFVADMTRRFKKISKAIWELVVLDDAFGLTFNNPFISLNRALHPIANQQVERQAWRFQTNPQKVRSYRKWLKQQIDAEILTPVGGLQNKPWTAPYIESAYRKGTVRAFIDVHSEDLAVSADFFEGTKAEFLRGSFSQPEVLAKVELLYQRAFTELEGVTAVMDQQMSRILAEGLSQGKGPKAIARDLRKNATTLTRTRANVIARTEIIRAHAEGQLDAFERLGVEEVGVLAEWSTAGDERVCPLCGELEGVVMTIEEARGLIPRHANCRCTWIPANKKIKESGQKTGKAKDKAIEDSIQEEGGKNTKKRSKAQIRRRSVWPGKDLV